LIKENIDKLSIQNYKLTNDLLNQNINLSKNIYEKIEEGNNGFNLMSFGIALFCPYLYIILALATRGGCGIFDANCLVEPIRRLNP